MAIKAIEDIKVHSSGQPNFDRGSNVTMPEKPVLNPFSHVTGSPKPDY
jgi:hypothetical protein